MLNHEVTQTNSIQFFPFNIKQSELFKFTSILYSKNNNENIVS